MVESFLATVMHQINNGRVKSLETMKKLTAYGPRILNFRFNLRSKANATRKIAMAYLWATRAAMDNAERVKWLARWLWQCSNG